MTNASAARVILHVDMNCFFASVERAKNPFLKEIPLAVAGNPKKRKGVLVTCSYEARAYGVYTTMTVGEAKRRCPELTIVPPNMSLYRKASSAVFSCLRTFTSEVEPVSIDEAYLDITAIGGLQKAVQIAQTIQKTLLTKLDLPCSIGIGPNKFLAKTASNYRKPLGITILRKRQVPAVLWPLPTIKMHGIGKKTAEKLANKGIQTIGDLAKATPLQLQLLGKQGKQLQARANGLDSRLVDPAAANERKSVGSSTTLPKDEESRMACLPVLQQLATKVARRLVEQQLVGYTLMIQWKTADWQSRTRSQTSKYAMQESESIYELAAQLFMRHWDGEPIRLLGITVSEVVPNKRQSEQLTLETYEQYEKKSRVEDVLFQLQRTFGEEAIGRAGQIKQSKKER